MKPILAVFILALSCLAQPQNNQQTLSELNGRFRGTIPPDAKALFIMGFAEGMGHVRPGSVKTFPKLPYGDIVKGVDRFYEEPENLVLGIGFALEIFTMKVNGVPRSDIEKRILEVRTFLRDVEAARGR